MAIERIKEVAQKVVQAVTEFVDKRLSPMERRIAKCEQQLSVFHPLAEADRIPGTKRLRLEYEGCVRTIESTIEIGNKGALQRESDRLASLERRLELLEKAQNCAESM